MTRSLFKPPKGLSAWRSRAAWVVLLVTVLAGVTFDLASKTWSFKNVGERAVQFDRERLLTDPTYDPVHYHAEHVAIPNLLQYRLVINRGAVFGIAANQRWFFIAFTLLALAGALYVFGRLTEAQAWSGHIAVGLVIAGGLGNLADRVWYGAVRDFLHMFPDRELPFGWTWPGGSNELFPWVFNVADVMLLSGMLMVMMHLHRRQRRETLEDQLEAEALSA